MLKIISGKFKGQKLKQPDSNKVRPTTHKIREAVFDMIQFNIKNSIVLDLFAGSGAYGIEAISRGATKVIFNDNSSSNITCIRNNLNKLDARNFDLFRLDFSDLLRKKSGAKFDIIFLDPPYDKLSYYQISLELIKLFKLLESDGYIVLEKDTKSIIVLPKNFIISKEKQYGNKSILLINQTG